MAKPPGIQTTTAIPTTRGDGTVHFKYAVPMSEQICQWALVSLWVLAPVMAVAVFWF
ncbi:MAG TPA: hypothetical protein VLF42_11430 [Burkholderiales bacterium]|nr:hypothetical protein [Burkholderiales bacterium]